MAWRVEYCNVFLCYGNFAVSFFFLLLHTFSSFIPASKTNRSPDNVFSRIYILFTERFFRCIFIWPPPTTTTTTKKLMSFGGSVSILLF